MDTYDDAAFDRFCSGLINAGFSPTDVDGLPYWTGPIRASLRPLTDSTWMQIRFYAGWPLRYAHVYVEGLRTEHDAQGTICLWAEDDPAQIDGRELEALWDRIDQWAAAAQHGFSEQDRALDAYRFFGVLSEYQAELALGPLLDRGGDGYVGDAFATVQGKALLIEHGVPPDPHSVDKAVLTGAFYLRDTVDVPPRTLEDVLVALARRQRKDLRRGLALRSAASLAEPSGGHDFIVLAWPRHGDDHDAVVLGFSGTGDTLQVSAMAATPTDIVALRRRAGPDADHLANKKVLLAGVGSIGGHVAVAIASSGVGALDLCDSDRLTRTNLVRHVCTPGLVGYKKTRAVGFVVKQHAPWSTVTYHDDLPYDPAGLLARIEGSTWSLTAPAYFRSPPRSPRLVAEATCPSSPGPCTTTAHWRGCNDKPLATARSPHAEPTRAIFLYRPRTRTRRLRDSSSWDAQRR